MLKLLEWWLACTHIVGIWAHINRVYEKSSQYWQIVGFQYFRSYYRVAQLSRFEQLKI